MLKNGMDILYRKKNGLGRPICQYAYLSQVNIRYE